LVFIELATAFGGKAALHGFVLPLKIKTIQNKTWMCRLCAMAWVGERLGGRVTQAGCPALVP